MRVGRRDFLKYCIGSAAELGLNLSVLGKLEKALAADSPLPSVIWLEGAGCTGCRVSPANLAGAGAPADVADLLINTFDLAFHPNPMGAAGDAAVQNLKFNTELGKPYILAIDGGIPTAFDGHDCVLRTDNGQVVTAGDAVLFLASKAQAVLALGVCASFGGIPSGNPNPAGIVSVRELAGNKTINIPGCPIHPDWIVWTIANLLVGETIALDSYGRPKNFFNWDSLMIHKNYNRKEREEADIFGTAKECSKKLGCKGTKTAVDCFRRRWKDGTSTNVLRITKAEWRADNSELKVEGEGKIGSIATVSDTGSGALLGATSVGSDGRWTFSQKNPYPIPSCVTAESPGEHDHENVKNAPDRYEIPTGGATKPFRIKKAEWSADKSGLKVEGEGDYRAIVTVFDATTDAVLGMVSVDIRGKWKFRQKNPHTIPGRVSAESNGYLKERYVAIVPLATSNLDSMWKDFVSAA